jgi:sec-independent protein translocase protein TatB
MFGIGSGEFLVIMILALVLIGPQKLPDLLRAFGKGYAEFRRMTSDVRSTLEREIEKVDENRRIEETRKELFGDDAGKPAESAFSETVPTGDSQSGGQPDTAVDTVQPAPVEAERPEDQVHAAAQAVPDQLTPATPAEPAGGQAAASVQEKTNA